MRSRSRRCGERGITLIEVLVASAILAIVGLATGSALSISVRLIGNGGTGDHVATSAGLLGMERTLVTDVDRADCASDGITLCGGDLLPASCSGATLCLLWCANGQLGSVAYVVTNGELLRRADDGSAQSLAREVTRFDLESTDPVQLTVTLGARAPQTAHLTLRPLVNSDGPRGLTCARFPT